MDDLNAAVDKLMLVHYREEFEGSLEMQAAIWVVALDSFKAALLNGIEELNKRLSGFYELKFSDWHVHLHKAGNENRFTSLYVNHMSRPGVMRYEMFPPSWGADFGIARMGRDEYKWQSGEDYLTSEQLAEQFLAALLEHTSRFMRGRL